MRLGRGSILVIDGYEQLGRWRRWCFARGFGLRGCGLLVTAHTDCGLPTIYRTSPDLKMVERLIEYALPPHGGRICRDDVERAWRRNAGNVREVFFELYDRFEARSNCEFAASRL
jgi:hypothetical protein